MFWKLSPLSVSPPFATRAGAGRDSLVRGRLGSMLSLFCKRFSVLSKAVDDCRLWLRPMSQVFE